MATTIDVLDLAGAKVGSVDLPAAWFEGEVNVPVMHQVVTAQLAAALARASRYFSGKLGGTRTSRATWVRRWVFGSKLVRWTSSIPSVGILRAWQKPRT